ncbi:MAG: DUF2384 domain-containing protein [Bacteroidales bacterium]|nr:DUF2384 domain-containing protein [Bacteroidales bacterium]
MAQKNVLNDPVATYSALDDKNVFHLIKLVNNGIPYSIFRELSKMVSLSTTDWPRILHISERTFQRYKKEDRKFDKMQSEKIVQVILLFKYGVEVFGDEKKFNTWLKTENMALGKIKPKELLDNSFGIDLIKNELTRIEHGILA